jgi:hypothetical protein
MQTFNSDLNRLLSDAKNHYEQYIQVERMKASLPNWMRWKDGNGKSYLVKGESGGKNQKSLGPRSSDTETIYEDFLKQKEQCKKDDDAISTRLAERAPQLKSLGIGRVPNTFARITRKFDVKGILGSYLLVGGTHAIYAYEVMAGTSLDEELRATEDIDFIWPYTQEMIAMKGSKNLLGTLKEIDATFSVNTENQFSVRNNKGLVVDFITSPEGEKNTLNEYLKPIGIPGQEWLLLLPTVSSVVIDNQGLPLRFEVPDPRLFALHKLWISDNPDRDALKRDKDIKQGKAIIQLLEKNLINFPFDKEFISKLPSELLAIKKQFVSEKPIQKNSLKM